MRVSVIFRKTFADFSSPRLLAAYFVPFLAVGGFLAFGFAGNLPDNLAAMPLRHQERQLLDIFASLSFFWGVGIPLLTIGSVLSANTLALEAETGTLRILLSKPIRRWEVALGTFLAIVAFAVLVGLASQLLIAACLYFFSGASPAAIGGGLLALVPGNLAFAGLVAVVTAGVGTGLAVLTRNRLRTALGGIVLPIFYFAFILVRQFSGVFYEDYFLYLVDVSYHFGNAFVLIHEAVGSGFTPQTQAALAIWSGVYDPPQPLTNPLLGGMPPSLDPVGYLPQVVSLLLLLAVSLGLFGYAVYRFERMDVP
jgi:ABC-2 type transport system permease protein